MKLLSIATAGLVALTALAPIGASAQTRVVRETRTVTRTHTGPAFRHRSRTVCHVERHGPRRVRVCRTVRY